MRIVPRRTELQVLARTPLVFAAHYRWSLMVLAVGAFFDALTTYQFLVTLGPDGEVHPVQRLFFLYLLRYLSPLPVVSLVKSMQVGFVLLVAAWWQPWCRWLLLLCGVLYGLAALSNHFGWL